MNQHEHNDVDRALPSRSHEGIREMLPEYTTIRASGRAPGPEWRDLEAHLATCYECRTEVEELLKILIDTYTGRVPPAPSYPPPDFSFLPARQAACAPIGDRGDPSAPPGAEPEGSGMLDHMRHLMIQFSAALLVMLREPNLAGEFRHALDPQEPHGSHYFSYQHPHHSEDDLHVTIDVSVTDEARKLCRILVSAVDPRDPFDQEGRQVTLRFGTFSRDTTTDHQGYAAFTDIPLDSLSQLEFTIARRRGPMQD